jgi:type VI secretion system protein ImpB
MPTIESTQHKLSRVRPPRVQITYDVETGGEMEKIELPFVFGIMADLGVGAESELPDLASRKFVEIDRDNIFSVMKSIRPSLSTLKVDSKLPPQELLEIDAEKYGPDGQQEQLTVDLLQFSHVDDFSPTSIVYQIDALRHLFRQRQLLRELQAKLDGHEELSRALQALMFRMYLASAQNGSAPPALTGAAAEGPDGNTPAPPAPPAGRAARGAQAAPEAPEAPEAKPADPAEKPE